MPWALIGSGNDPASFLAPNARSSFDGAPAFFNVSVWRQLLLCGPIGDASGSSTVTITAEPGRASLVRVRSGARLQGRGEGRRRSHRHVGDGRGCQHDPDT